MAERPIDSVEPAEGPLSEPSAEQARAQLAAAEGHALLTPTDRRVHAFFAAGVGVAVALVFVLCWWTASQGNTAGMVASLLGYGVVILLMFLVKGRARSIPRGFGRAYTGGFVPTMTLYAVLIAWVFSHQDPWPPAGTVAVMAVAIALPSLIASVVIARRRLP